MKKFTFTAVVVFATVALLSAQTLDKKKVPASVIAKFSSLYPTVTSEVWSKGGKDFEVDFNLNKLETAVGIDAKANLLFEATEIKVADMPKLAADYVDANYGAENLTAAKKIVYPNDGKPSTHYNCETKTNILVFDRLGNFQGTMKK